jgi:hypothetical protein
MRNANKGAKAVVQDRVTARAKDGEGEGETR